MTMKITCDQCGLAVPEYAAGRWRRLEMIRPETANFGDNWYPQHFCSIACLAAWAREHTTPPLHAPIRATGRR